MRPESPTKRESRVSSFDDRLGLLNKSNLSRELRRLYFAEKARLEEEERYKRSLLQKQVIGFFFWFFAQKGRAFSLN